MTTVSDVYADVRARIEANAPSGVTALRWQNEDDNPLPDTPASFIYTEVNTEKAKLTGYGGGQGSNLYRTQGTIDCYVFVPRGQGLVVATQIAEAICTLFRSLRTSTFQCTGTTMFPLGQGIARSVHSMMPPGLSSPVDNYYSVVAQIDMWFDQVG